MVAASAIRVMIVDDDDGMRRLMRRTLERMGFTQIYAAKDGVEGLELAHSQRPDVIISDYEMPNLHGLQLLKAIREDAQLTKTGFIMLTGVANDVVVAKAQEIGVNSIIIKPFFADGLKHQLGALVQELTGSQVEWHASWNA